MSVYIHESPVMWQLHVYPGSGGGTKQPVAQCHTLIVSSEGMLREEEKEKVYAGRRVWEGLG